MGPLLALTFGTLVDDSTLVALGLRNGARSLVIATAIGFVIGLVMAASRAPLGEEHDEDGDAWPSEDMQRRGQGGGGLLVGLAIAIPSGIDVLTKYLACIFSH